MQAVAFQGGDVPVLVVGNVFKQQEIADLIGMHRSNYSKIENGQREISVSALDKIARFFNVSIDWLVHLDGDLPREVEIETRPQRNSLN